jgi:hypothetical protein
MKVNIGPYTTWIGPYQIAELLMKPRWWIRDLILWCRGSQIRKLSMWDRIGHDSKKIDGAELNETDEANYQEDEYRRNADHNFGDWLSENRNGGDSWLLKVCLWIERKKKRKVEIRIDKYDTWSMDATLSMIILPMLKQLKATKHGAPLVDDKDVPKELRSTSAPKKENEWDTDENHFKRWDWVLDEMIWTFEQLNDDDNDSQFHTGKSEMLWQALDKDGNHIGVPEDMKSRTKHEGVVTYEMVKGPNDTSVFDKKGYEKHHNRIQNGLILFGKYYRGLWD